MFPLFGEGINFVQAEYSHIIKSMEYFFHDLVGQINIKIHVHWKPLALQSRCHNYAQLLTLFVKVEGVDGDIAFCENKSPSKISYIINDLHGYWVCNFLIHLLRE